MDGGIDTLQKQFVNINIAHNKVHTKQLVYALKKTSSLGSDASIGFYIKTDINYSSHLHVVAVCSGDSEIILQKASTSPISPTGQNVIYSRFNQKDVTSFVKTKLYNSITGGIFEEVWTKILIGGTRNNNVGGDRSSEPELPLEKNSWYYLTFTNRSIQVEVAIIEIFWYEINNSVMEGENRDNPDLKIFLS